MYKICVIIVLIISAFLTGRLTAPQPTSGVDTEKLFGVVMKYREMIARDDRIINFFMAGEWNRSKCVEHYPIRILADSSHLIGIQLSECEED